jgi:tRNA(Ile)-lysidine synthase
LSLEISEYLQQQAQTALDSCLVPDDEIVLDIPKLTVSEVVLQREVLRLALAQARGDLDRIEFVHLDSILSLCQGRSGQSTNLPGGWRAEREFEYLRLTNRPLVPNFAKELTVPGRIFVEEVESTAQVHRTVYSEDEGTLIRCEADSLLLRNWRPGDRFLLQPGKSRRLKRIFQERKIPRAERTSRLILVWKDELVWVQGIGVAAGFSPIQPGESCLEVQVL